MNDWKDWLTEQDIEGRKFEIVGGEPVVDKDSYPWMTALVRSGDEPIDGQFCGGSLIAPDWVLTAAHCLVRIKDNPEILYVVLGLLDLAEKPNERLNVQQILIHPNYNRNTSDFDVALLRLAQPSQQKTIAMIPSGDPGKLAAPGTMAIVIGWGALQAGGGRSQKLMKVEVPIMSNAEANIPYQGRVTENMIAAGYKEGQKDACQGDSGGPFVVRDENLNLVLGGATSWGIGCARPKFPGIYANLSVLGDWVKGIIGC